MCKHINFGSYKHHWMAEARCRESGAHDFVACVNSKYQIQYMRVDTDGDVSHHDAVILSCPYCDKIIIDEYAHAESGCIYKYSEQEIMDFFQLTDKELLKLKMELIYAYDNDLTGTEHKLIYDCNKSENERISKYGG